MISTSYDPDVDALYVRIAAKSQPIAETREIEPGIMLDLDAAGHLIGIEVLNVSARTNTVVPEVAA